jgi:signal transduction histidine kinase
MKRLYFSIVISVLGALFLISWGLDQLVAKQSSNQENTELVIYKQLIDGFSKQLSLIPENQLANEINQLALFYQVKLSLEQSQNIALPHSLSEQLSQQGGLLLASGKDAYLLKKLTKHPHFLVHLQLPIEKVADDKVNLLLTITLYLGICGIILLWLFPLTRRIYLLTSAAAKIGTGDLAVRVPQNKFSYIRLLENSFNHMASRIEKLVADNKILARSLSHDIRTPMSCLRFGVEAALDAPSMEKKNQYLMRMENELTQMEDMTSAFLEYAGMERKGFHLKYEKIDVNQLISIVSRDCQSLAEQHNIRLNCQPLPEEVVTLLDFHWCYRAIMNLVSNAVQYANSEVILSVEQHNKSITISVEDDGKGIPHSKRAVIFSPFVKLDADRSRENGHFGLGLAISAKVMGWHHGSITAHDAIKLSGARFTLNFPLATLGDHLPLND